MTQQGLALCTDRGIKSIKTCPPSSRQESFYTLKNVSIKLAFHLLISSFSVLGAERLLSEKKSLSLFGFFAARPLPVVAVTAFVGLVAFAPASHPLNIFPW